MNNPNPFLPQGVFLEQKTKARARLKIAVLSSIGLSVMVLMVLLIQGCKKPAESGDGGGTNDTASNTPQLGTSVPETNTSNTVAMNPAPETNVAQPPLISNPPPPVVAQPPPPVAETQEYTIVKGDLLSHIATANHTTVKAIMDANPGINPKALKIGQKIKLPAPASASGSPGSSTPVNAAMAPVENTSAGGVIAYKVKSGDTLDGIRKKFHVTVKAIQSANSLTTTSIKVGQVLKIPGATTPAPEAAPVPAPAPVAAPMAAPTSPTAAH